MRLITLGLSLYVGAMSVFAEVLHISAQTGEDANSGAAAHPWKTFDKALHTAQPGDVVTVHAGIYRADQFQLGPAGKDSRTRTVFQAAPGERVLLTRNDGTPPGLSIADYVRAEGFWIGGRWTKEDKQPNFAVGGSPIGRGKQIIGCTIFGYSDGIAIGSSEDLLIQKCRIVHCGKGRFMHGCYLSDGYTKGAMTQHVIVDDNVFVAGEGYAIHGWHNPHSTIITRNFITGFYWDLVLSGSDHVVAYNTFWRNTGQKGHEPGWNAWLPAERVVFVNNILNSAIAINDRPGKDSVVSHNAYLTAAPHADDAKPFDLRRRDQPMDAWIQRIDTAVDRIDAAFNDPIDKIYSNTSVDEAFSALNESPPAATGLSGADLDIGLVQPQNERGIGRTVRFGTDFWGPFDRLKLHHFNNRGEMDGKRGT